MAVQHWTVIIFVLTADKDPEIVGNPEAWIDVTPGEAASFSVRVIGDDPLEYLWEHQSGTSEAIQK